MTTAISLALAGRCLAADASIEARRLGSVDERPMRGRIAGRQAIGGRAKAAVAAASGAPPGQRRELLSSRMPSPRRFPPPWSVEESHASFTVRDGGSIPHVVVAEMSHPAKLRSRPLGITAHGEAALPSSG